MLRNNRIIWKDAATLKDLSSNLSNPLTGTEVVGYVAADDALYIGSDLPFNHRWFEMSVVNDQASVASIEYWDGSSWIAAVDIIDETIAVAGKSLSQSGIISWAIDRDQSSWVREDKASDISDLSTLKIYDMYWVRVKFSADLKTTTAFKYIGHKFSSDTQLFAQYPALAKTALMAAFTSGKTSWNDQAFEAAEYIIQDLREMGTIWSKNQILSWEIFKNASIHRIAMIVFVAFGEDYENELKAATKRYGECLQLKSYEVDQNENGILEQSEKKKSTEYLSR